MNRRSPSARGSQVGRAALAVLLGAAAWALACGSGSEPASGSGPLPDPANAAPGAGTLVVRSATVIDGTGAPPQPETSVVLRDGLIESVGTDAETPIPPGAQVLDARGRYVIPGLADMHVHFGEGGVGPRREDTTARVLEQFLAYGVTTVLNLGATGGSIEDLADLRRRIAAGLPAPRVLATGGLMTVPGSHPIVTIMHPPAGVDPMTYDWTTRGVWVVSSPAEVRDVVRKAAAGGADGVKLVVESGPPMFGDDHPQMPPEMVEAAVDEAARHGLPVFAHATSLDELEVVVAAGVRAVVHLVLYPGPPGDELLAEMRRRDVYYLPTLSIHIVADAWGDPSRHLTDPFLRAGVRAEVIAGLLASPLGGRIAGERTAEDRVWRRELLAGLGRAHSAGVRIATGSDTSNPFIFPGYSLHHELALMVEAGMSPMEALVAATHRPAEMMRQEDSWGTLQPGRRADLLILTSNPLEDIRNTRSIETVVAAGRVIERRGF